MTDQTRNALKELQRLDEEIEVARQRISEFGERIADVEEPALALESEVTTTRSRLQELKVEERRTELSAKEKAARVERLDERLKGVRNVREEAAVSAELEMVKRSLESEEQEAYSLLDQIRKIGLQLEEQESALEQARAEVEPRRLELESDRASQEAALGDLQASRTEFATTVSPGEIRMYEGIRKGGRRRAVAALTEDGACGHCFSVLPLQLQNEIRHGRELIRCEACGVILAQPSAEDEEPEDAEDGAAPTAEGDETPLPTRDPGSVATDRDGASMASSRADRRGRGRIACRGTPAPRLPGSDPRGARSYRSRRGARATASDARRTASAGGHGGPGSRGSARECRGECR
jgi:predicted  nucleic acid-binding Zn-ribbon protein